MALQLTGGTLEAQVEQLFLGLGQLESHGRLRAVRKEIARIYTVMRERELGIITLIEDSGEPEDEAPAGVAAGGAATDDEEAGK